MMKRSINDFNEAQVTVNSPFQDLIKEVTLYQKIIEAQLAVG